MGAGVDGIDEGAEVEWRRGTLSALYPSSFIDDPDPELECSACVSGTVCACGGSSSLWTAGSLYIFAPGSHSPSTIAGSGGMMKASSFLGGSSISRWLLYPSRWARRSRRWRLKKYTMKPMIHATPTRPPEIVPARRGVSARWLEASQVKLVVTKR